MDSTFTAAEFATLQALVWERPIGDVNPEVLFVLRKRKLIRTEGDGWSITFAGHTLFLQQLARTF